MADLAPAVDTIRVPNPLTDSLTTARAIQDALGKLKKEDADQIRSLLRGEGDDAVKAQLGRVTSLDAFKKASGETMVAILTQLAAETRDGRGGGMRWVLSEPNFARLDPKQQTAAIELLTATSSSPTFGEHFAKLLGANGPDGKPLLLSPDSKGKTLLENLTTFANSKFHADATAAGLTPAKMIGDMVREMHDAVQHVDQGNRGACAAASMQDLLCRVAPSEYVRLVTGLMVNKTVDSRDGSLTVAAGSLTAAKDPKLGQIDLRSHSERIFQSALLDRVSTFGSYSYANDSTEFKVPGGILGSGLSRLAPSSLTVGSGGMTASEMTKAMTALFGPDSYDFVSGRGSSIHSALRASGSPSVICMNWDGGKHALVYAKSDEKYVYLKDPQGGGPEREPNSLPRDPVPSSTGGNIRMTIADFEANLTHAHIRRAPGSPKPTSWGDTLPLSPAAPLLDKVLPPPAAVSGAAQQGFDKGVGTAVDAAQRFNRLVMPTIAPVAGAAGLYNRLFGPSNK